MKISDSLFYSINDLNLDLPGIFGSQLGLYQRPMLSWKMSCRGNVNQLLLMNSRLLSLTKEQYRVMNACIWIFVYNLLIMLIIWNFRSKERKAKCRGYLPCCDYFLLFLIALKVLQELFVLMTLLRILLNLSPVANFYHRIAEQRCSDLLTQEDLQNVVVTLRQGARTSNIFLFFLFVVYEGFQFALYALVFKKSYNMQYFQRKDSDSSHSEGEEELLLGKSPDERKQNAPSGEMELFKTNKNPG